MDCRMHQLPAVICRAPDNLEKEKVLKLSSAGWAEKKHLAWWQIAFACTQAQSVMRLVQDEKLLLRPIRQKSQSLVTLVHNKLDAHVQDYKANVQFQLYAHRC